MKVLLFILFSLPAFGQHYFVVPLKPATAESKYKAISARFYQLSQPDTVNNTTRYLFSSIRHPVSDSFAIVIDTSSVISKGAMTSQQMSNFITEVYGSLTTTQRNTLTTYINSNTILRFSRLIITSRLKLWTRQEMEARGWFNYSNVFGQ